MGCSATAGRLCLGSLGLESDALGSPSALWARDRDNQLFRGLGRWRVWADAARRTFDRLEFGDGDDSSVDGSACSRRRQLEKADRMSRTLLARARTRAHMISERLSSRGSLAEPGLRRRRRERVPRELLPRCYRCSTPVEPPCLEVLPRSRLLDGQISFSEWLPTDEPCRCRRRRGGRPLPRSIRNLVLAEQVPTRSRTLLAALASES
jgi:hypothetical protein